MEKLTAEYDQFPSAEKLDWMDTLVLLIEKCDEDRSPLAEMDPITLLKTLMRENGINQQQLAAYLDISKGHLSDILNYKKGLSKSIIRKLSDRFKVDQKMFNRGYGLLAK
ncbi:helix-turn-helix domain-containing protein [Negadavirga shengliensis]|uniref:Type II toxin-antitoxin system HigA family antitoxin n=1 Tax=Negadavirga shengliensis TaxID=1389218 RepID=A0ABV9T611_9BACT